LLIDLNGFGNIAFGQKGFGRGCADAGVKGIIAAVKQEKTHGFR